MLWYTKNVKSIYFYTGILSFCVGVVLASVYAVSFVYIVWLVVLGGALGLVVRRRGFAPPSDYLQLLVLFCIACALGIMRFNYAALDEENILYERLVGQEVMLEGIVVREPDVREKVIHLYVQVEDELLLVKAPRYADVSYGDLLVFQGELQKPEAFETDLGRTFQYPEYLHARGVSYTVSFANIEILQTEQGNRFIARILKTKEQFMQSIERVLPEPQVGLAEGLLLGVKQALGDELESVFRKTGIIHIVVLSGYNVMLVVIFITYILSYVMPYRWRSIFGIGSIICFAILVGLSATVVRACIMASLILVARSFGRRYAVVRALLLAGLVMILLNPYLLVYDVGFQLSFVATLGLLFLAPHIEKLVMWMPTWLSMREFLTATIATQIFVMPILLYNIGELSVVSIVVNVLVLPMVPVAMLLTFLTGIAMTVFTPLAVVLGYMTYVSLSYILGVATFFAQVPLASFSVPAFPFWVVPVSYGALVYVLYRLHVVSVSNGVLSVAPLAGWTIEEEHVVQQKLTDESLRDSSVNQLPTFFR